MYDDPAQLLELGHVSLDGGLAPFTPQAQANPLLGLCKRLILGRPDPAQPYDRVAFP
jgi:hypothetical protein